MYINIFFKGNKDGQHLSSSTSDLLKLFETEKALLKLLKETNIERNSSQTNDPNVKKYLLAKKQYLNEVDFRYHVLQFHKCFIDFIIFQ